MLRVTILLHGIPTAIGNTAWSPVSDVTVDTASLGDAPQIRQTLDALGGVATYDDLDIDVVDVTGAWARWLRPWPAEVRYVLAPNPINHDTTGGIVLDDATGIQAGDVLFADRDTWRVTYVSGNTIHVQRGRYPCLPDGIAVRYQAGIATDHVCRVSTTSPPGVIGRLCAVWIDGVLDYLGHVVAVQQTGRGWRLRVQQVLSLLTQAIRPPSAGLRLRHPWTWSYGWWICGQIGHRIPSARRPGGGTADAMTTVWDPGWTTGTVPAAVLTTARGWTWIATDDQHPPEIADGPLQHGARAALGGTWSYVDGLGYCTCPDGLPPYGVMVAVTSTPGVGDWIEAGDAHYANGVYQIAHLVGCWLRVGDQYVRVHHVDDDDGRVWLDCVADAGGNAWTYQSAGVSSRTPIELPVAPIIEAASLPDAIAAVLTGTGPLGLGLPPQIVDTAHALPVGGASPVWWDWSQGGIDDDLRARGLAVIWRNGRVVVRRAAPPTAAGATKTVAHDDVVGDDVPTVDRAHDAPVSAIAYADAAVDWTVDVPGTDALTGAALRVVRYQTATGDRITEPDNWIRAQATRLQWLRAGAPVITIRLLHDTLQVGDVIILDTSAVSVGDYRRHAIPGVVLARAPLEAEYSVALNLGPTAGAVCWALSLGVTRAGDTTVAVADQEDLVAWQGVTPVGTPVRVRTVDGGIIGGAYTIAGYSTGTVVLAGAALPAQTRAWYLTAPDTASVGGDDWLARQVICGVNGRLI